MTKRERLFQALSSRQSRDGSANNVLTFVEAALNPSSFANRGEAHTDLRESTNRALAFAGYFIADDGKVRRIAPARTVPEAIETASGLMSELIRRRIHPEVVKSSGRTRSRRITSMPSSRLPREWLRRFG